MSSHRLALPPAASQILAEHRRAGVLRWRCRKCGQSWRCLSRAWADDIRCDLLRGRRPRVASLPIGHGTDVSSEVSDAMAVRTQGQAADAAAQVSAVRSEGWLLPHYGNPEAAHPV